MNSISGNWIISCRFYLCAPRNRLSLIQQLPNKNKGLRQTLSQTHCLTVAASSPSPSRQVAQHSFRQTQSLFR